jgi:hypothetical protein
MITKESREWITDLGAMTCQNYTWKITVAFEKQGEAFIGKISEMPENLSRKWAAIRNGDMILDKIVEEAKEIFSMAYFEHELERCGIPKHNMKDRKRLILTEPGMGRREAGATY